MCRQTMSEVGVSGNAWRIYRRKKTATKELQGLDAASGATLMELPGIGPSGVARLVVEFGVPRRR